MALPDISIVKISLAEPAHKFIILKTTWSSTPFQLDIMLLNEEYASIATAKEYTGTLSMEQIEAVATELDVSTADFLKTTKIALATDNGSPDFSYELEPHRFRWHKNGVLKMIYGAVDLYLTHSIGIELLLSSLQLKSAFKSSYERVNVELTEARRHHEQMQQVYDRFVTDQLENEERNLTKFLALLNTKKAKIAQLENLMSKLRGNSEDIDSLDDRNELLDTKNDGCDEKKEQSNEPSTSGLNTMAVKRLPKRKKFSRNHETDTNDMSATNPRPATTKSNPTPSTSAAAVVSENSHMSIYSKDTEEIYMDL